MQDPYSIRCQPQVLGPCLDALRYAADVFAIEANAATDNPLIFEDGAVLSGGNFHAEPVAIAADALAIAIAEMGAHCRAAHRASDRSGAERAAALPRHAKAASIPAS